MNTYEPRLIHDNFQNYKRYGIPRAQLVIEYIAQLPIPAGGYVVIHPQLTDFQKNLLEERL